MTDRGSRVRRFLAAMSMTAAVFVMPSAAFAETLYEALVSAYTGNPTLIAGRAGQRATDEVVPQAFSTWRPTVTAEADVGLQLENNNKFPPPDNPFVSGVSNQPEGTIPGQLQIVLNQPVFNGFLTRHAVREGEANVEAGRQNLLQTEQDTLFQGVTAFMDVILARQILQLRQANVRVLQEQLKATTERFNVGEVTKTDVAQAQAALALAQAQVASARSELARTVATYVRVIGHAPGSLKYPKLGKLPRSLDGAIATADQINPQILAAAFVAEAARQDVGVQRSGLLPQLSVQATVSKAYPDLGERPNTDTYSVFGVLQIPLYEGGEVYSLVRQAKQIASQRRIQIIEIQRAVRETVTAAWNAVQASYEIIRAQKAQVSAAQLAAEGVRQEYLVGTRTTLDVLEAEQTVLDAQEELATAQRDQIVFAYQLVAATGRLTAMDLGLGVQIYDPTQNYRKVRNKWFGTKADTID